MLTLAVTSQTVLLRVDGDGEQGQLMCCSEHPNTYLPTICHKYPELLHDDGIWFFRVVETGRMTSTARADSRSQETAESNQTTYLCNQDLHQTAHRPSRGGEIGQPGVTLLVLEHICIECRGLVATNCSIQLPRISVDPCWQKSTLKSTRLKHAPQ